MRLLTPRTARCDYMLTNGVQIYTVRHKNTPIFYHNLKKGYPILIILGTHILDTTVRQMTVQFFYLSQRLLLHYLGK